MKIFKKRGEMTHFQILSEIAKNEPNLKQKDLSERIGITIQAVSENIKSLIENGYIKSADGRSPYTITTKGLDKLKKDAISLRKYSDETLDIMSQYKTIWPAVASENVYKGDIVGLYMENGLLYADNKKHNASAKVLEDTKKGYDVPLNQMNGVINIDIGQIIIILVPPIKDGGSRVADINLVKEIYNGGYSEWGINSIDKVAAIGTVSHVIANKLNIPIHIEYAAGPASVACSKKGLNVMLLVVGNMMKNITSTLEKENVKYNIVDIKNE